MHDITPRKNTQRPARAAGVPKPPADGGGGKTLFKELLTTALLAVVALTVIGFATQTASTPSTTLSEEELAVEREKLAARDVIEYEMVGEGKDAQVSYSYAGGPLPAKLAEDEVVERRTERSYTRDLGADPVTANMHRYETVAYAKPAFISRDGTWHYVEYDTAPRAVFEEVKGLRSPLSHLLAKIAHAQDSFFSGTGDGSITFSSSTSWDTVHDAATGSQAFPAFNVLAVESDVVIAKSSSYTIFRTFIPFDTSAIPANANIAEATLNVYASSSPFITSGDGENDEWAYVSVVDTSQPSETTLTTADFDLCGDAIDSPTEGVDSSEHKDVTDILASVGSYITFNLNSTGIDWIKKSGEASTCGGSTGFTCLGLRMGHDIEDVPPDGGTVNTVVFSSAEATGTSQDPYLAVTYSAAFAFWQFEIF